MHLGIRILSTGVRFKPAMLRKPAITILLVDDDPLIRSLGQELLEHLGYRVEVAGDGSEALKKYRQLGSADLVILDYYLPGQDGCQVLKEFKAADAGVRVLVASGFFAPREAARLRQEGALGLINKPYRVGELERLIEASLARAPGSRPGSRARVRRGKARLPSG
jgi:two-component system cell cycle sensor histidine kinase/response regulator CckA